ncbi:D-alanyl-D-alanine carboxypeptidase/D-alanyl-D-alanine endopeptidase [Neobacillus dielmonensis]|uniref:D-alanyl-D-alanine carboxypeptidase/D-alanyl-D-alanine endopeptidase n=1 Tax=Neobacillus dielmonensis TaxID=1347369 RepID=UPI0005A5E6B1|nr:D-alanyl-D-alanine carboxypeptidase/D-alanyl-D-alanine-endopeptidase [Neobacillus dielmonensis]
MKKMLSLSMIILLFMVTSTAGQAATEGQLNTKLNQLLSASAELQGGIVGISVRNAADGHLIYQHLGDIRLRPASNMKLLTAAAALNVLGEAHTFPTEVYRDGPVKSKILRGDLYLKGKGDPTLMESDFNKMAEKLQKQGIKQVNGNLVGDDTWYDGIRYSLDLPWSDEMAYYGAQISALTASPTTDYDAGAMEMEIRPGTKPGDKVTVDMTPKTNYVKVMNRAETVNKKGKKKLTIEREHAKNTIIIGGTVPLGSKPIKEWIAVWDPTRYALTLFKQSLAEHGIEIRGKIKTGRVPDSSVLLLSHQSMPLSELLVPFMKLSNNTHAEILIKEMGKVAKGEGSWEKGIEVLKEELVKFGVDPATMVIRDGSGVSHVDLIPANQISQLLFSVQSAKWFPAYLNALPVAGDHDKMVGGTLRSRMRTADVLGRVKAKTGTISTVRSLSGYVTTANGQTVVFSILLNNLLDDEKKNYIEDQIVRMIAE